MDTLSLLAVGLTHVLQPVTLSLLCLGVLIGVVVGALPGISFANAMALSLPFSLYMTPETAVVFMTGIYVGGIFGGSISAILINIPGSPSSLPSTWEGFPMTQQGQAAKALGYAIVCSAIGGVVSALLMTFVSPPFAKLALTFNQVEFFAATLLGLATVVVISQGALLASLLSLFFGLLIGSIGPDPFLGEPRLTFGLDVLASGIDFVVVLIGMFAIGEVIWWFAEKAGPSAEVQKRTTTKLPSLKDIFKLKWTIARSSGIGCMIGSIPGAGAIVGAIVAYGVERTIAKDRSRFGKGEPIGLAATETANNATTGAATIPLLTLGIPGSAATAIMLATLMIHGIQPGALLFLTGADLVYTVFMGFFLANVLMVGFGLLVARAFATIMRVRASILFSSIVVLCVIGAFGVRNNVADIFLVLIFGVMGYFLRRFNIPTVPLILGVILGPLAESYLLTALITYNNDVTVFFTRPYSAGILTITLFIVVWSLWPRLNAFLRARGKSRLGWGRQPGRSID